MTRPIVSHPALLDALRDLRDASEAAYKSGRIAAEPFVRAGNLIADAEAMYAYVPEDADAEFDALLREIGVKK